MLVANVQYEEKLEKETKDIVLQGMSAMCPRRVD